MNKKAAIEFSANVIVIIIISSVILGLGLMLFFNLKGQAERYTDTIEQQTAEQLKALMLNDNSRVAVYPNDLTIQPGKSQMTTVAVNNQLDNNQKFESKAVQFWTVEYYATPTSTPYTSFDNLWKQNTIQVTKSGGGNSILGFGLITKGEQEFRNILIKMPRDSNKGQYIFTTKIYNYTSSSMCGTCPSYGLIKLYVTVP